MNNRNPEDLILEVKNKTEKIKPSSKPPKDYLFNIICMVFGLILFLVAIYMTFTYIEVIKNPTTYDQGGRIYFLLLILYAVAAPLFLVGGLKAYAEAVGKILGWSFWLTGGAAVFTLIIFVGFLFSSNYETFNLTARVIDSQGKSITIGTVTICFDENKQTIPLDPKGEANFKGIPPKFKTMKKPVDIDIDGYRLIEPNMLYSLAKSVIIIRVEREPNDEKHAGNSIIQSVIKEGI